MATTVPRLYSNFRGVDFRGEEINLVRSPDCLNVWKDYRETESIRTRPGMKMLVPYTESFEGAVVNGIFFYRDEMLLHLSGVLFKYKDGVLTPLGVGLNDAPSEAFVYEDVWYFKDGKNYLQYNGETISDVHGYVPTTSIGRKPNGGGSVYEDVNMISDYRKNTFLADESSFDFYLDTMNIDQDFVPVVTFTDQDPIEYTVNYEDGIVSFVQAPHAPLTDGKDNIIIEFKKSVEKYKNSIMGCRLLQVFDNRVFFSGNADFPNYVWHCSLNDPTYISDLDYYREGMDSAQVKGMVAGNNALWVFREPSDANTNVFYHTPMNDDSYGKIYPSSHSSITLGCIGKAINFNDDIVFFSERGMEGISGDIGTEQFAAHRSSLVDRKLLTEDGYKNMILVEWEGYLLVIIGDKVYLADSRTAFTNENHIEYDWFYWQMEKEITCARVHDGVLYLGADDGIYTLTDNEKAVESYWTTPKDKFSYPHKQKTTNKRGCVAEATGDIAVYAKVEDSDFELIGQYNDVTDYFVSRIKRKKFKDIQLKFYSRTRFSLETVTLECFIGGYIKR